MTATNHALTGAAIALAVKKPELAIPLAFLSHFVLDAIPHYGPRRFAFFRYLKVVAIDAILALACLVFIGLLFPAHFWLIFACMGVSVGPDVVWLPYRKNLEQNDKTGVDFITRLHWTIQWKEFPMGIFIEAGWAAIMLVIIFNSK